MNLRPFSRGDQPSRFDAIRSRLTLIDPRARRAARAAAAQRAQRRKRALVAVGIAAGVAAAAVAERALMRPERRARLRSAARDLPGRARGLAYRAMRRHPDEVVPDQVLADRVRSTLGPLEKRLDIPHVHVTTCDGVVALHGSVGAPSDVDELTAATRKIAGVRGIESHLHIGLTHADTRPSVGRQRMRLQRIGA